MKTAIKKDKSTREKAGFWSDVEASAGQVHKWPEWKKEVLPGTAMRKNIKTDLTDKTTGSERAIHRTRK